MSMLPHYYNNYGNHKKKTDSKGKEEHEKWLLKNGCHPSQIKARKKPGNKARIQFSCPVSKISKPNLSSVGVTGLKKEENKYSGKEIIGVAVMHKSNLVPIRSKEAAADIAKMRR